MVSLFAEIVSLTFRPNPWTIVRHFDQMGLQSTALNVVKHFGKGAHYSPLNSYSSILLPY